MQTALSALLLKNVMKKSLCEGFEYRNFRLFTRTADYLHRPIVAYGKKKVNRLPALVDNPHVMLFNFLVAKT